MNDDHRPFYDPRSLSARQRRRMPFVGQIVSALLTALLVVLVLLAITAASWAILYLIHTAP